MQVKRKRIRVYIVHSGSVSILCHAHIQVYTTSLTDPELIMVQRMYATYSIIHERCIKIYTACTLVIFVMFMYIAIQFR